MKKIRSNVWYLILVFFGLPIAITTVIVFCTDGILEATLTKRIMTVSNYLFTVSSLIIVFVLYRNLNPSDYHKDAQEQKYLDENSIDDLYSASRKIKYCIKEQEVEGLAENCSTVSHVYNSLKNHENDVVLKAYQNHLKNLCHLINKNNLISIGLEGDFKTFQSIPKKNKTSIWRKADELERYVKRIKRG
ncbi:hypothetical protein AAV35_000390 [Salimicrobium jeotgali]|uniref:Uncharacterized protein n=1 Tax=Salimicrobium jeotgali TaxID=1230341 RepID=K2G8U0_9BACI|nr:hypothetical protein [Salimicrobium jeotgali]AKG03391.1 hypothetical protein AAV35_000390 [Salimicrobium jeotgali]EKE30777.1 hypothetical protein MJ3_11960 [Salimicrobium jeotgali]MBM7697550.1 hypothetical protein [Salimicrobium jeotgali]